MCISNVHCIDYRFDYNLILIPYWFNWNNFFVDDGKEPFVLLFQVEGFKMNLIYFDLYQSTRLEKFVTGMSLTWTYKAIQNFVSWWLNLFTIIAAYGEFLKANGEKPVTWKRASSMEEVLVEADVVRNMCQE